MSETPVKACCSIIADQHRLEAVKALSGQEFDQRLDLDALARLTAYAFKAPICVISLVSDKTVRFIGKFGLDACEVALDESLCTQVVCRDGPVEILNLSTDPDLSGHPVAVGPPYVRAYCGQPLLSPEGQNVGAVAVVDTAPFFRFSDEDREALKAATEMARRLLFGEKAVSAHSEAAE
ncbi:GAF domain-containing protein [Oceanicaulis sp. LC35]|uniref:GAF domain-containing protein n=1 Tax=Oceanicaulis sp. LC35 TaxID=3349635 RepID=UPI003F85D514